MFICIYLCSVVVCSLFDKISSPTSSIYSKQKIFCVSAQTTKLDNNTIKKRTEKYN